MKLLIDFAPDEDEREKHCGVFVFLQSRIPKILLLPDVIKLNLLLFHPKT